MHTCARTRLAAAAAILCTMLFASGAFAASVLALDTKAHLEQSDVVVLGTVGASSQTIDPEHGTPLTDTVIHIDRVLAGTHDSSALSVRQMKGFVGDQEMYIPGDGHLRPGGTVVLFLMKRGNVFILTVLGQSVWDVKGTGADAGVEQQLADLALFTRDEETGAIVPLDKVMEQPRTLGALEAELAAAGKGR